ncbi:MAG: leucine-rich repeat protein [Clostridiales bacterium]|nr:leucine-rich repeat protein [Clostridiales bacterium]
MKKLRIIFIVGVIATLAVLLAACGAPPLPSPQNVTVNEQTLQLSWDEVEGAKSYIVSFGGEERTTRRNTYSLSNLASGTYGVKVRAVGDGDKTGNSAWSSEIMFVRPVESGLSYRLINSNTEYEVSGMGTASGEVVVDSVYRGKPVTRIGDSAFYNSGKLTSITIGENVTSIGVRAFYNCSYLQQVIIPEGVTEIGEYAFQNCRALTSVKIPNSVTKINDYAFSICRALDEIDFGDGVTEIGKYAFTSCVKLENLVIPDTIKFIDEYAFSDCVEKDEDGNVTGGIKSVTISGATELGGYAFNRCSALTTVNIGSSLKTIGMYAFSDCDALNNVVIPDNVETIKEYAFYNCDALDTIEIGKGVTSIGMSAFRATKLWNDVSYTPSSSSDASYGLVYADKWLVGNKDTSRKSIAIAADTIGIGAYALSAMTDPGITVSLPDSLKYIGDYAFAGCAGIAGIALKNVERVGDSAFYNCANLGSFSFRESLRSIGSYAFAYCKYLNNPTTAFSENFESIGSYAFYETKFWNDATDVVYCSNWVVGFKDGSTDAGKAFVSLKANTLGISDYAFYQSAALGSISVPDTVKRIGTGAFRECSYLVSVRLPAELKEIKAYTFYKCYNLTGINWPNTLETIGRSAFYNCFSFNEIVIPDCVKEIDDYAFYNLTLEFMGEIVIGTEKIVIGAGVEKIGNYAFAKTTSVEQIAIPDSVKALGVHVFDNCGFTKITIGKGLESINDYAFRNCVNLTELVIPGNIKYIGKYAFKNCSSLKKLTIEDGVENIGQYAFSSCSALMGLAIPDSVTYIDNYAFCKCGSLKSLNIGGYVDYVGRHAFYGNKFMTVYFEGETVPDEWNGYWNSSYRPVVFGTELSSDKTVVLSVTLKENGILYLDALNGIAAPVRPLEYDCVGWSTTADGEVEIRADEIDKTEGDKKLYPVWEEYVEPEPEPEPDTGASE